jgi:hypothetical protein
MAFDSIWKNRAVAHGPKRRANAEAFGLGQAQPFWAR